MKNLSIEFIEKRPKIIKKIPCLAGEITIGDFFEGFDSPLAWWSREDYEQQWKTGIERLKNHEKSCLVTKCYSNQNGGGFYIKKMAWSISEIVFCSVSVMTQRLGKMNLRQKTVTTLLNQRHLECYLRMENKNQSGLFLMNRVRG